MPYMHEFTDQDMGGFGVHNVCGGRGPLDDLVGVRLLTRQPDLYATRTCGVRWLTRASTPRLGLVIRDHQARKVSSKGCPRVQKLSRTSI